MVGALVIAAIVYMVLHRKRREREYEEEPMQSVSTKFTGAGGRDLRSPFDASKGFNSFDEYNQSYPPERRTESYYEDDYVEGYAGVAGFGPVKDNRQSAHAGIGGFGVAKSQEPMPPMPAPPTMPSPDHYDPAYAAYEDEWETYQKQEAAHHQQPQQQPQQQQQLQATLQPAYRGGHDSTVEGLYFSPQAYDDYQPHEPDQHGLDVDEDQAFEPAPYFQANELHQDEEDEEPSYAIPMPQFEVEDYYMRDHLTAEPIAPMANPPAQPINWMNNEEKAYFDQYKK
jgi:hypothetical protein